MYFEKKTTRCLVAIKINKIRVFILTSFNGTIIKFTIDQSKLIENIKMNVAILFIYLFKFDYIKFQRGLFLTIIYKLTIHRLFSLRKSQSN